MSESNWIPEILYEEDSDGSTSNIPFVIVPEEEEMPCLLYMFESRETGDYEPGLEGEDVPVTQWDLHQYADMVVLKQNLDGYTFDLVRVALGLEPLVTAVQKGHAISSRIRQNLDD